MSTISSYLKEITARLKSDDAGVIAALNERKSLSATKGSIAALEANIVDQEELVKDAEEALKDAKYPTTKITDNGSYLMKIQITQESLDNAKEELDNTNKSLVYWNALVKEFSQQVEA